MSTNTIDLYTLLISTDNILNGHNFGSNEEYHDLTDTDLKSQLMILKNQYGDPTAVPFGFLLWEINNRTSITVQIHKNYLPIDADTIFHQMVG